MESTLRKAGVKDICILKDSDATKKGIVNALNKLATRAQSNDKIVILFSCHGQLITDLDGDDIARGHDGDQAIIPYDAQIAYNYNGKGYKGEHHLIDDELNHQLSKVSSKIGSRGQLIVLVDACHSGDVSRGPGEEKEDDYLLRGIKDMFNLPITALKSPSESYPVSWICLSACEWFQDNRECVVDGIIYGRLVWSFCNVFKAGITPNELVNGIKKSYHLFPIPKKGPPQELNSFIPHDMGDIHLLQ